MSNFNLYQQLSTELSDFFGADLTLAGTVKNEGVKFLSDKETTYSFNQWQTINRIEMYYNSQFESGKLDSEGQRKWFLNICNFRADIASKQVDIDTKNFVFVPEQGQSVWGAYFMQKKFRAWAKENFFGETINQTVMDYPKYGTAVLKRVGGQIENVPLMNLRNQQDAKSLAKSTYVIEEHRDMTYSDMENMPGWDVSKVKIQYGETKTVYERYGFVPLDYYKREKGLTVEPGDEMRSIDTMAILVLNIEQEKVIGGATLFFDKIKKRPYEEVHFKRQRGRWLGIGEVENLFENQVAENMVANMRRKALYWSSKKIFQTQSTETPRNLAKNVHDGEVLMVGVNGQVSQVDMTSHASNEFQNNQEMWKANGDQKTFSYEVATGEALPSGTPFRLGVVLSNAVNSHFALKREQLGLFFVRLVQNQLLEVFKKENRKKHTLPIFANEDGANTLKEVLTNYYLNAELKELILSGKLPNIEATKEKIKADLEKRKALFMDIEEGLYDEVAVTVALDITGEAIDLPKRIETLTTLYNSMVQAQDPRSERVLSVILSLSGENKDMLVGEKPPQQMGQPQLQQAFSAAGQAQEAQV